MRYVSQEYYKKFARKKRLKQLIFLMSPFSRDTAVNNILNVKRIGIINILTYYDCNL